MSNWIKHRLRCHYSGLPIGTIEVATTAGALPYLSNWNKVVALHPVFSLTNDQLFKFAHSEWKRLASKVEDETITEDEEEIIRVTHLAMLHTLGCIKQDHPGLASIGTVRATIGRLFALAYWKWKLESEKFAFPVLHVSKTNHNTNLSNLSDYLDVCMEFKEKFEKRRHTLEEQEKLRATEKALEALSGTWIITPNKKILWRWIVAHLDAKYRPDAEGWLSTLFLGGSSAIIEFAKEDIDLAQEIIESSCPVGTGILHAVRERMNIIRTAWKNHHTAFEIDLEDYAEGANLLVNGIPVAAPDPGPAPKEQDFQKRALYLVAEAKWRIAYAAWKKQQP